ncbi:ribosome biogenesis GTPase Der [Candidatus Latescibacterota bacterium]
MSIPIVAIVGRPNVGKSTLFNRLIGKPFAIIHGSPGVTRDRNSVAFEWNNCAYMLVDTGGFIASSKDQMELAVTEQSRIAIEESDVLLFLVDVKSGITDYDLHIRDEILKSKKPYILGVNKIDRNNDEADMYEFYNLGTGEPHPISGKTGRGSGDLLDEINKLLPREIPASDEEDTALRIALIGRPNVGKSSIVNSITGKKSVIVTDIPGTTRDSTDTYLNFNGREVILVDTAGLKRITKLKESLEYYSFLRTQKSLSRCDVAIVVIDIDQGLTSYDKNLVDDVTNSGNGLIIIANKWDLVEKETMTMKKMTGEIFEQLPDKSNYPIIFTSAITGKRIPKLLETAIEVNDARKYRIPTSAFNDFIEHLPIPPSSSDVSILYGTQYDVEPPSFKIFVKDKKDVKNNFVRYLERSIREKFGFLGTPLRISFTGKKKK